MVKKSSSKYFLLPAVKLSKKNLFLSLVLVIFLTVLDVILKSLFIARATSTSGHFIDITLITNTGTMWGLFHSASSSNSFFIILSVFATIGLFYALLQQTKKSYVFSLSCILAGVFGNLFDRIFHKAVIDWINFHFWPIFNLADVFIVVGVIITIYLLLKEEFQSKK